jgi:hypothetical protein
VSRRRDRRFDRRFERRPLPDEQEERLGRHPEENPEGPAEAQRMRRLALVQRLMGPVESEADWQAQLRMFAGHFEAAGLVVDRSAGHDAWRLRDGELEISRALVGAKP